MKTSKIYVMGAGALLLPLLVTARAEQQPPQDGRRDEGPPPFAGHGPRDGGPGDGFGGRRFGEGPGRGPRHGARPHLMDIWSGIGHLEKGKLALSKVQARRILALVLPWTKKPQMTEAEADKLRASIEAVLMSAQKNEMMKARPTGPLQGRPPRDDGREGPPPGGPPPGSPPPGEWEDERGPQHGRPDGPPPMRPPRAGGPREGQRPGHPEDGPRGRINEKERDAMRPFFEHLNPFYPPTGYAQWKKLPPPLQKDLSNRYRHHRATLEALSRKAKH